MACPFEGHWRSARAHAQKLNIGLAAQIHSSPFIEHKLPPQGSYVTLPDGSLGKLQALPRGLIVTREARDLPENAPQWPERSGLRPKGKHPAELPGMVDVEIIQQDGAVLWPPHQCCVPVCALTKTDSSRLQARVRAHAQLTTATIFHMHLCHLQHVCAVPLSHLSTPLISPLISLRSLHLFLISRWYLLLRLLSPDLLPFTHPFPAPPLPAPPLPAPPLPAPRLPAPTCALHHLCASACAMMSHPHLPPAWQAWHALWDSHLAARSKAAYTLAERIEQVGA